MKELGTNKAVVADCWLHRNCTAPNYLPDDQAAAAGQDVFPGEAGVTMPCCLDTLHRRGLATVSLQRLPVTGEGSAGH